MSQNKQQPPPAAAPSGSVQVWADTHPGKRREGNEDNVFPRAGASRGPIRLAADKLAAKGHLVVVADGVGGAKMGSRVSQHAVEYVSDGYYDGQFPDAGANLKQAVESANHWLYNMIRSDPTAGQAATTLTAAVVVNGTLHVAHVGDSRAYLIRSGQITQLTKDHTLAQEKFDAGQIQRREDIPHDAGHSTLTRSLGTGPTVQVDVARQPLLPGDVVLLCSDGLYDEVPDDVIRTVAEREAPKKAVKTLIQRANRAGGNDNISVAVMRQPGGAQAAGLRGWQRAILLVLAVGVVAMVGALAAIVANNLPLPGASDTETPTPGEVVPLPGATQETGVALVSTSVVGTAEPLLSREPTSTAIPLTTPNPLETSKPTPKPTRTPFGQIALPTLPFQPSPTPRRNAPPAPTLLRPEAGVILNSRWRFEWQWNHAELQPSQAFDLLIWSEEENGLDRSMWRGVITPGRETFADVEVGEVATVKEHGAGTYYWTVIVIHKQPYKRIGQWGELRSFTYQYPPAPVESPKPPTNTSVPPTDKPPSTVPPPKTPGATATPVTPGP